MLKISVAATQELPRPPWRHLQNGDSGWYCFVLSQHLITSTAMAMATCSVPHPPAWYDTVTVKNASPYFVLTQHCIDCQTCRDATSHAEIHLLTITSGDHNTPAEDTDNAYAAENITLSSQSLPPSPWIQLSANHATRSTCKVITKKPW